MYFIYRFLPVLLVSLIAFPAIGQVVGGMNFKLEKLFIEEKYEDVAYKGISMVESDKYKKDPEVYLYIAMAWYEISQMNDEAMEEEYPKALQDAFKYAAKFASKDKEGVWYEDNADFFENLKKAGIADAAQYVDDERKRRNAVSAYKYMVKAMPDDPNILFYKGVLEQLNRNTGQAERDINQAMGMLVTKYADSKYRPSKASKPALEEGFIRWADIMMEQNYADSAKKTINWGLQFMPDSEKLAAKGRELGAK
ncbi:MAG: hypothetical protein H6601_03530 [Flavobacteriales bacterium]|nr:hypothetical protein [Flavobacteriales bacterium]